MPHYEQDLSLIPKHGHYNVDVADYHRVKSNSWVYRALCWFPARHRVFAGTLILSGACVGIYPFIMPSPTKRPVRTLTKEWREAEKGYAAAQKSIHHPVGNKTQE
jgi:hypothetical protein